MQLYEPHFVTQVWGATQLTVVAGAAGWAAGRVLDPGLRGNMVPLFAGLAGLLLGPHLLHFVGWSGGPSIAGHSLVALFVGSLIACGFVKLLSVGFDAHSRHC
jgi:hypothetical protein